MQKYEDALETASRLLTTKALNPFTIAISVRTRRLLENIGEAPHIIVAGLLFKVAASNAISIEEIRSALPDPDIAGALINCCIFSQKDPSADFAEIPDEDLLREVLTVVSANLTCTLNMCASRSTIPIAEKVRLVYQAKQIQPYARRYLQSNRLPILLSKNIRRTEHVIASSSQAIALYLARQTPAQS